MSPSASPRLLMPLLASMAVLSPLSVDLYIASMDIMARDLAVGIDQIELSLSAYFIGLATGQLIYGPISDAFGRQKPLIFGLTLYILASLGCAFCASSQWFIACRALQALGACANMVTSRAVVRDLFEPQQAARIFSALMLASGLAPILAPTIGSLLAARLGWRALFFFLAGWAILLLVMQAYLLGPNLVQRVLPKTFGVKDMWRSYNGLVRDGCYMGHVLGLALLGAGLFAYMSGSAFVFMELGGLSQRHYSWLFALNGTSMMIAAQINRVLVGRMPLSWVLRGAAIMSCLFGWTVALQSMRQASVWGMALPLTCYIASLGFIFPNAMAQALSQQKRHAASASALGGMLQWGAAGLASACVSRLHDGTARPLGMTMAIGGTLGSTAFLWAGARMARLNLRKTT